jgi:hypothetical protein
MIQLDDDFFENLTNESVEAVIERAKKSSPKAAGKWSSLYLRGEKE